MRRPAAVQASARCRRFSENHGRSCSDRSSRQRIPHSVFAARRRHGSERRRARGRRRHRHRAAADEPHPLRSMPENRIAVVQPGVVNLHISQAVAPHRSVLRAGSLEPDVVQHRRKRCGKLRRPALPEVWNDDEPHSCDRGGDGDRAKSSGSGIRQANRSAWICWARSSVPKEPSRS